MALSRFSLLVGSLTGHAVLLAALGHVRAPKVVESLAIEVHEVAKPAPEPETPPEPPPSPPPEPAKAARAEAPKATARAESAAPEAPEPAPSPLSALPDLGLELSGGSGGSGLAVAQGDGAPGGSNATARVQRALGASAKAPAPDACREPAGKPKLVELPKPAYTDEARAAGVAGKVRVEITVDERGKVVAVKALSSLGHGLDEAALAAARGATFEAALRCGKPARSTFTLAIRFTAA